jgi:hypothetical protein
MDQTEKHVVSKGNPLLPLLQQYLSEPGPPGTPGAQIYMGFGAPNEDDNQLGDIYIDMATGQVYKNL